MTITSLARSRHLHSSVLSLVFVVHVISIALDAPASDNLLSLPEETAAIEVEDFDDRLSILRVIAVQTEANYRKINTWKGSYELYDESLITGEHGRIFAETFAKTPFSLPLRKTCTSDVTFALDVPSDKMMSSTEEREIPVFLEERTGNKVDFSGSDAKVSVFHQNSILTDEHYLYVNPRHLVGAIRDHVEKDAIPESPGRVGVREYADKGVAQHAGAVVDPRKLFAINGELVWDIMSTWADWVKRKPEQRAKLERIINVSRAQGGNGPIFHVAIRLGSGSKAITTRYVFDADVGYNVTSIAVEKEDGIRFSESTWTYTTVGDIFIPRVVSTTKYQRESTSVYSSRVLTLGGCTLNEPLDPGVFSWSGIGLRRGERVLDKINNTVLYFDGKNLVSPAQWKISDAPMARRPWIVGANIVVVVFLGTMAWRRRKSVSTA